MHRKTFERQLNPRCMSSVFSTFPLPRTVAQGEMGCDDMIASSELTWSHSSGRKYIIVCKLCTSILFNFYIVFLLGSKAYG